MFDKIYEKLGLEKLDEATQTEIKGFISEVVDVKAKEMAKELTKEITEPVINEAKEEMIREYEDKYEQYRDSVISKFSDFVDTILEEELQIPENIKEFARKGELYSDLIDQLKVRVGIDEGALDEEARELLREAREEIISLREKVDSQVGETLTLKEEAREMAAHIYLRKKCDGLTEAQKNRVLGLIGDITDVKKIDEKFDFIVENLLNEEKEEKEEEKEEKKEPVKEVKCVCPKCGKETTITEGSCSLYECADCEDVKLVEASEKKEIKEEEEPVNPFSKFLNEYADIVRSKKI